MTDGNAKNEALRQLEGQKTEEFTQAVMVQRKLKTSTKALQKLQTKIKKLNPESEEYISVKEDEKVLLSTVAELSARFHGLTSGTPVGGSPGIVKGGSSGGVEKKSTLEHSSAGKGGPVAQKEEENSSTMSGRTNSALGMATNDGKVVQADRNVKEEANNESVGMLVETEEDCEQARRELHGALEAVMAVANQSEIPSERGNASLLSTYRASSYLINATSFIHPQVAEATLLMEELIIIGCNARTMTMIGAFKQLLRSIMKCAGSAAGKQVGGGGRRGGGAVGSTNDGGGPTGRRNDTGMMMGDGTNFLLKRDTVLQLLDANFNFMCRTRKATSGMQYVKQTLTRRATLVGESSPLHRETSPSSNALASRPETRGADRRRRDGAEEGERPSTSGTTTSLSPPSSLEETVSATNSANAPAERSLLDILESIEVEIHVSHTTIVEERGNKFVSPHDTILVFGRSSVVEDVLLHASKTKYFKVIIIDAAPLYEGRKLMMRLSTANISVTYGLLTSCCTLMPRATRVFIGAASVLQNGDVFSRCGTAVVAVCAKSFRRPVLCFSESYKFVPEVWLGNSGQNDLVLTGVLPCASNFRREGEIGGGVGGAGAGAEGGGGVGGGAGTVVGSGSLTGNAGGVGETLGGLGSSRGGGGAGGGGVMSRGRRVVLVGAEGVGGNITSRGRLLHAYWNPSDPSDRFFSGHPLSPSPVPASLVGGSAAGLAMKGAGAGVASLNILPGSPTNRVVSPFSSSTFMQGGGGGSASNSRGGVGSGGGSNLSAVLPNGRASSSSSQCHTGPPTEAVSYGYLYDLTPATCVDLIICEIDCLHSSAIVEAIKDREMRDNFL